LSILGRVSERAHNEGDSSNRSNTSGRDMAAAGGDRTEAVEYRTADVGTDDRRRPHKGAAGDDRTEAEAEAHRKEDLDTDDLRLRRCCLRRRKGEEEVNRNDHGGRHDPAVNYCSHQMNFGPH